MNKTGFRMGAVAVIGLFVVLAMGGYSFSNGPGVPEGWKTYTNSRFKYQISLPADWEQVSANPYAFIFKQTVPGVKAENFFTVAAQQINPDLRKAYFTELKGGTKLTTIGGATFAERTPFSQYCRAEISEFSVIHGDVWFAVGAARMTGKDGKLEIVDRDLLTRIIGTLQFNGTAEKVGDDTGDVPTVDEFSDLCVKFGE